MCSIDGESRESGWVKEEDGCSDEERVKKKVLYTGVFERREERGGDKPVNTGTKALVLTEQQSVGARRVGSIAVPRFLGSRKMSVFMMAIHRRLTKKLVRLLMASLGKSSQ